VERKCKAKFYLFLARDKETKEDKGQVKKIRSHKQPGMSRRGLQVDDEDYVQGCRLPSFNP
jgi:hypothetical protein